MLYDIHDDSPLEENVDCIISLLVLGTASRDLEDFKNIIRKLASELKGPGSTVILSLITGESEDYIVVGKTYPALNISRELALQALSDAGFICMNVTEHALPTSKDGDQEMCLLFISAKI